MANKYKFSKKSLDNLTGVHPRIVELIQELMDLQLMDFSVNEGVRTLARQHELVKKGASKTLDSKHLIQKDGWGHAVDIYPSPVDMKAVNRHDAQEISRFGFLAGALLSLAKKSGVNLTWGGDWDRDGETLDHPFFDAPHFQLEL